MRIWFPQLSAGLEFQTFRFPSDSSLARDGRILYYSRRITKTTSSMEPEMHVPGMTRSHELSVTRIRAAYNWEGRENRKYLASRKTPRRGWRREEEKKENDCSREDRLASGSQWDFNDVIIQRVLRKTPTQNSPTRSRDCIRRKLNAPRKVLKFHSGFGGSRNFICHRTTENTYAFSITNCTRARARACICRRE